jgi:uncharacterized protein (DUF58 family)
VAVDPRLFDEAFLASLRGIRLRRRRTRAADHGGDRSLRGPGGRVEFAGHRPYAAGDPVRHVDWAAWARLGRLFVKEHERDAVDRVRIALDASASMDAFGKWDAARRVAAGVGMLALLEDARVELWRLADGRARRVAVLRGRRGMTPLLDALSSMKAGGATGLADALAQLPRPPGHGGSLFLVSDLLDASPFQRALAARAGRGEEPILLEVLAGEEIHPARRGTLVLSDPEDAGAAPLRIGVGEREADAFAAEVRRRVEEHAHLARRLRGVHLVVRAEEPAGSALRDLAGRSPR